MKKLIKSSLNNSLFRKIIHKIPFITPKTKLAHFCKFLQSIKEQGPENCFKTLSEYEQVIIIDETNDNNRKIKLLQFIPITLVNPPEAWNKYYKKLFLFNEEGKIFVRYPFGVNFNPVSIAQYALSIYDSYVSSKDKELKDLFFKQVSFLLEEGDENKEEIKFPYRFDFFDMVKGPWVSGLAQAQAASVLLRAFVLFKDEKYLLLASKSIKAINNKNKLLINVNGYQWIEEYPTEKPSCVINGLAWIIISLLELKSFFSDDQTLANEINNYIKTYKENVASYDLGNGRIRYSLMDEKLVNNSYLGFQCLQMIHIYYYTRDVFFYNMHIKWQEYFDKKEFVSSYLPFNLWNRRLKDLSKGL